MDSDVLSAIERFGGNLEQFKSSVDARLRDLETREAKQFNRPLNGGGIETRNARAPLSTSSHYGIDRNDPEVKSFEDYIRHGERKSLSISVSADGGVTLPKVIDAAIESLVLAASPIRQIARVVPVTTSDYHKIVNLRGTASGWVTETAARPATTTPTFADVAPPAGEIYAFPLVTQNMLDDSAFDVSAFITEQCSDEFIRHESVDFVTGDGTAKPKGFTQYTTVATADGSRAFGSLEYVATGAASTLNATNPLDAFQTLRWKLAPQYRTNAVWVMNAGTLATISALKDSTGRFLVTPDLTESGMLRFLGHLVIEAAAMPDIGAGNLAVAFGDFSRGYLITDRHPIRMIPDPFTQRPYVGFYATKRVGGGVVASPAIKFLKIAAS